MVAKVFSILFAALLTLNSVRVQPEQAKGVVPPYLGETNYWYSDMSYVGRIGSGKIKVRLLRTCWDTVTMKLLYANAKIGWGTGYGSYSLTAQDSFDILLSDAPRSYASSLGIPANALAVTTFSNASDFSDRSKALGELGYMNTLKRLYRIDRSLVLLIYDSESQGYTFEKLSSIVTHEWGHALGYFGHDTNASGSNRALMYPTIAVYDLWGLTASTLRDRRHLNNGYIF